MESVLFGCVCEGAEIEGQALPAAEPPSTAYGRGASLRPPLGDSEAGRSRRSVLLRRTRTMMADLYDFEERLPRSGQGLHEEEEDREDAPEDAREEPDLDVERELGLRASVRLSRFGATMQEVDEVRVFFFCFFCFLWSFLWCALFLADGDGDGDVDEVTADECSLDDINDEVAALIDRVARECAPLACSCFPTDLTMTRSALWLRRFCSGAGRRLLIGVRGGRCRTGLSAPLSPAEELLVMVRTAPLLVRLEVTAPSAFRAMLAKPPLARTDAFGSVRLRERLFEERCAT
mmetsp:Transcript_28071/g.70487  ORF Transcript_28071/g.70487 Transcript_28071/m.70487 type:complete len:291 (-) Transcript_28071:1638-2510(-)